MWHLSVFPCPLLELDTASCRNGELLLWNAGDKLVTLFLTSGLHFFFPKWCTVDVLKHLFFSSRGTLCYAVASSHSSLLQRLGSRKPLGTPQCSTAPQSQWACLAEADGFIHWSNRSAMKCPMGSVSKDMGGLNCLWLQLPNFMSASP